MFDSEGSGSVCLSIEKNFSQNYECTSNSTKEGKLTVSFNLNKISMNFISSNGVTIQKEKKVIEPLPLFKTISVWLAAYRDSPRSIDNIKIRILNDDTKISSPKTPSGVEIQKAYLYRTNNFAYKEIEKFSKEVVGCNFFTIGCSDESLTFPNYQANFHIKGYRRIYLWGKDRPWTDTGLQVERGDKVLFYGTGEVTICSHCSIRGPLNLRKGLISYTIGDTKTPRSLENFLVVKNDSEAYQSSVAVSYSGNLDLTIRDWHTYPPPNNYYDDNSGAYTLDIFVIDPKQEEGFNRFRDALFEANPDDENAKAYLGKR